MGAVEDAKERFGRDFAGDYDIDDPRLAAHWEEIVEDLHSRCPVARSEVGEGYWVINRYDDLIKAAQDWETFSSSSGYMPNRPEGMPYWYPVECDPPFHDELRQIINKYMGPKQILPLAPQIRAIADDLIDDFIATGQTDVVSTFASPVPGHVFCGLVANIPVEDMPYLQEQLHLGVLGEPEERIPALGKAQEYLAEFLQRRADGPRQDDITDAVLHAEIEGYEFENKAGTLSQLTLGGIGTSGHVISSAIYYFAQNRAAADRYREEPSCRQKAVEEFIRAFAAAPQEGRRVQREVEVSGVTMKPGDFVLLGYGAASRDPEVTPDPGRIDFDRSPNRHVAFGAGLHRCAGSHLARLQIRIALEAFTERLPDVAVPADFEPHYEMGVTRTMMSLPVTFAPGPKVASQEVPA